MDLRPHALPRRLALALLLALPPAFDVVAASSGLTAPSSSSPSSALAPTPAPANAARVREAFAAWREGRGSVFDLLHPQVEWTVAGHSPVSGVYRSRAQFMDQAVAPINARLATPIVPRVEYLVAQDDAVVVVWSGEATAHDGRPYRNRYAWHMRLSDGQVVQVTAFLDTWALQQLMH